MKLRKYIIGLFPYCQKEEEIIVSDEFEEITEIIVFEEIKTIKKVLLIMSVEDTPYCRRFERTHESVPACNYALNDYLIQYFFTIEKDKNYSIDFNNIDVKDLYYRLDAIVNKFNPDYIILHTGIAYLTNPDLFDRIFTLIKENYPSIICGIEDINLSGISKFSFDESYEMNCLIDTIFLKNILLDYKVFNEGDLTVIDSDYEILIPYKINPFFYNAPLDYYFVALKMGVPTIRKLVSEMNSAIEEGNIEKLTRIFHTLSYDVRIFNNVSSISKIIHRVQFDTQLVLDNKEYRNELFKQILPYLEILMDEISREKDFYKNKQIVK